jgi:hypothetical protein
MVKAALVAKLSLNKMKRPSTNLVTWAKSGRCSGLQPTALLAIVCCPRMAFYAIFASILNRCIASNHPRRRRLWEQTQDRRGDFDGASLAERIRTGRRHGQFADDTFAKVSPRAPFAGTPGRRRRRSAKAHRNQGADRWPANASAFRGFPAG